MQGSQNGPFINLHNSLKLQNSQKKHKIYKIIKKIKKIKQNCCKSGSSLKIADPLWSCVMLLCGPLRSLVIPHNMGSCEPDIYLLVDYTFLHLN